MQYRRLGRAGVKVSEIALGSWLTYGTVTEEAVGEACVHRAYELGINHFDCANVYGAEPHAAERVLAKALKPFSRDSYVLTTKAFWPVGEGPNQRGLSRKHLRHQLEESLRTLGSDYVDIFYCHRFDPETELEEVLTTLDDFVREGKVLYPGISEWKVSQMAEAVALGERLGLRPIRASQPIYNLLNRYIEPEIVPFSERHGIGLVVFSPLAQGLLTGKYRAGQPLPEGSRAATREVSGFLASSLNEATLARVERLAQVAEQVGLTLTQMALAWTLRLPAVSSALIGASKPEQVEENVRAADVRLDDEALAAIERALNGDA